MMRNTSKILVVVVTAFSLSFLGFAAVTLFAGPNWVASLQELPDYVFEYTPGEPPMWSAKTRRKFDGEHVAVGQSTPVLPAVILASRNHWAKAQDTEIQRLKEAIERDEPKIDVVRKLIAEDLDALEKHKTKLYAELDPEHKTIDAVSDEGIKQAQESQATRAEAAQRREDVFRLTNQLAEIRTDRYRALQQKKKIEALLIRIRGSIGRAQRRKDQLIEAGARLEYEKTSKLDQPAGALR